MQKRKKVKARIMKARMRRGRPAPTRLINNLQAKLDEFHEAGKFSGSTLGVCRANV
jgi:hypothetical protein